MSSKNHEEIDYRLEFEFANHLVLIMSFIS